MESQKGAPRVLRAAIELAAANDTARAATNSAAADRAAGADQTWALDFMTKTLYDGRRVRLLTIIDEGNREGLEIAMAV